jgi:UDP-N-acetyl-D-glucosamine/UDP-N-acetyl-D-galactosamine dehydrogenase
MYLIIRHTKLYLHSLKHKIMYSNLINKEAKLSIVGLGYVGLPLALEFAKIISVIGFDINQEHLDRMRKGIDPSNEMEKDSFQNADITFTSSIEELKKASFFIIAVPTPIDKYNQPDLTPLLGATRSVAKALKKGDYVVYESTVYPGCTEEDCLPILEEISGLKCGIDFKLGYSPERINPGEKVHTLPNTVKIVSGCDSEALEEITKIYEIVVKPGVFKAKSIKVAEAAKIVENTQRDVNIALMNELSIIFEKMGINTYDVLEAAGTKWNFLKFYPGLVGGHCIGVDPYYLVHKASALKYHCQIIKSCRFINDSMGGYIGKQLVKKLIARGKSILGAKVLIMGITFKENVSDVRNSKVVDIINELKEYGINIDIIDGHADSDSLKKYYSLELIERPKNGYDAIVVAVSHKEYIDLDENFFTSISSSDATLFDIKGIYRNKIHKMDYWSL